MSYPLSCCEKDNYSFGLIETAVEETNQIWGENWNWGNGRFESVDSINIFTASLAHLLSFKKKNCSVQLDF